MSSAVYDLIIIGGGPAGITAGIYAARKKINALLITKDFFGQIAKASRVDNWPGEMAVGGMDLMQKLEKHLRQFAIEIKDGEKVVAVLKTTLDYEIHPTGHSEPAGEESDGTSRHPEALSRRISPVDSWWPFAEPALSEANVLRARFARLTRMTAGAVRFFGLRPQNDSGFCVQTETNAKFEGKTIIIATGAKHRTLGIPGEKEFLGRGFSHCAICEAPFFKDKQVVVLGGGNSGFETALDLAKYVKKVFIFERGPKVRADELLQSEVKDSDKIKVLLNAELLKIEGQDKVQLIVYKDLVSQKIFQQPMDGVFSQIGAESVTDFLGKLVRRNKNKEIVVKPLTMETSRKGIFAAGDCNDTKFKQMIIAAGQGATAALGAYEYLQK